MQTKTIATLIQAGLPDAEVTIDGDGTHFNALVISNRFQGLSRLQRQQRVNDTVKAQLLDGSLHALSIKACTPDEWQTLLANSNKGT